MEIFNIINKVALVLCIVSFIYTVYLLIKFFRYKNVDSVEERVAGLITELNLSDPIIIEELKGEGFSEQEIRDGIKKVRGFI